jgi:fatty-acyl-CoA synthase/long-chain acyl-CoA synthetase
MSTFSPLNTDGSLYEALHAMVTQYPDDDALVLGEGRDTYRQLGRKVDALAAGFSEMGIGRGDKIAIILPVCRENVYVFFALAKLGAPFVPISPQLRSYEVRHILSDSDAIGVVTLASMMGHDYVAMLEGLKADLPKLQHIVVYGGEAKGDHVALSGLLAGEPAPVEGELPTGDDIVGIMFTSGTTGLPKGAMHTHRSMLTEIDIVLRMFTREDLSALLNSFPMFHHSGIAAPLMFLLSGGKLVLQTRFDPREALRLIEEEKISFAVGAPVTAMLMLRLSAVDQRDLSSLRVFGMGGSLCPPELIRTLKERLGCVVFNGLGITEAGFVSTTRPDDSEELQATTVGRPAQGVEVKIVDDDRSEVPVGEAGEIACRSAMVMEGYYGRPEETAQVLDDERWYYTGDVGSLDADGYLMIFDRKKDMIIRGGENIYAAEIEHFLATHPQIQQAAVIGVPGEVTGERVRAYVKLMEGAQLSETDVVNYCRGQIANYKLPEEVRFVESFPLSALWKVQKYKLRDEAIKEREAAAS